MAERDATAGLWPGSVEALRDLSSDTLRDIRRNIDTVLTMRSGGAPTGHVAQSDLPTMGEIEALIDAYRNDFYAANAENDSDAQARLMSRRDELRSAIRRVYDAARQQSAGSVAPSEAEKRLDHIAALTDNWDSYGAPPPWPESVERARRLIRLFQKPPAVTVGGLGNVQLEWYGEGFEVELYVDHEARELDVLAVVASSKSETPEAHSPATAETREAVTQQREVLERARDAGRDGWDDGGAP